MTMPNDDEWCREESCRHRHWRSGSMPTHKRGADCPPPVTAPSPAGLSPLLDQLDEARAAATPGEWFARDMEVCSEVGGTSTVAIEVGSADAALIVAAVNALPLLVAALRAAWEVSGPYARDLITAALTPGADTAGATA